MADAVLRGVNLGGWLIAESWMTPALFEGVQVKDETSIITELGKAGKDRLRKHHETFITEADFKWLKGRGINSVRLPVPHWLFGDIEPYIGCLEQVDWVFDMARKYGIKVLLDLHTAPGSQNGEDHSGRKGPIQWHTAPGNITFTVELLERLALRYGKYPNLWGIELLNEPSDKVPLGTIKEFYEVAYRRLRTVCDNSVVIVMHDSFRPEQWSRFFSRNSFDNVALDLHLYQVFGGDDKKMDIHKHLKKVLSRRDLLDTVQLDGPALVGEWSLGLPKRAFRGLDAWEADKARQAFGTLQINTYQNSLGWFFWSYKTQDKGGWNFRECVEKGWLPPDFGEPLMIETVA